MTKLFHRSRRSAAVVAVLALVAALATVVAPAAGPAGADAAFTFSRFAGANRDATAALIATNDYPGGSARVLLARDEPGGPAADALGGTYLAGSLGVPILLTDPASLPAETDGALKALNANRVTILGGIGAVSANVETQLMAKGYNVDRVQGANRYDTAAKVASTPAASSIGVVDGKRTALLANGENPNSPDALSAGPAAFAGHLPLLLTTLDATPAETVNAISQLQITQVDVLGGTAVISEPQAQALRNSGLTVNRIFGLNRSGTAVAIATQLELPKLGFDRTHVNLARGDDSADALAGAPHAGKEKASLQVTINACTFDEDSTGQFLRDYAPVLTSGHIFGGSSALCGAVQDQATIDAQGRNGAPSSTASFATLSPKTVITNPGATSTATISGQNLARIDESGCGTTARTLTPSSPSGATTVTTTIPSSQSSNCTLTFVVGFVDGSNQTLQQAVTVQQNGAAASPGAFGNAGASDPAVTLVDRSRMLFVQSNGTTPLSYTYKSTDTYQLYDGIMCGSSDFATFTQLLTVDDAVSGTYNPAGTSTFCLNDTAPYAPASVTVTTPTIGVTISFPDSRTPTVVSYQLFRTTLAAGTPRCPGFNSRLFSQIATISDPDPSAATQGTLSYNDLNTVTSASYCYAVRSVDVLGEVGGTKAQSAPPITPAQVAPQSVPNFAKVTISSGSQRVAIDYNVPIDCSSVDPDGSDFSAFYTSSGGVLTAATLSGVLCVPGTATTSVTALVSPAPTSGQTLTVSSKLGGDSNTVKNQANTASQPPGDTATSNPA